MPETRSGKRGGKKGSSTKQLTLEAASGKKYIANLNTFGESDSATTSYTQEEIIEINMASKQQDQQTQCKMAERLEAKMDKILSRIDQIEENIESKFSVLSKRVSELESKVEKLIKDVDTTKLLANDAQFEAKNLKDTLVVTQKLIKALESNVDDLQGCLRRKTLVFRGIPEDTEDGTSWNSCKEVINLILVESFGMYDVEIERAHRSPTFRDYTKSTPRPVIVAFLRWDDANTILSNARRALKSNPPKDKVGGSMKVFIDQLYSPKVSEARQEALKKRWQIKQKHPDWSVFLKYPARIFVRRPEDDHPEHIKDDKIKNL